MSYKFNQKWKAKVFSAILAASMAFTSFISTPVTTYAAEDYGLADNIQDGVILHCFNWKYNDIKAELQDIAEAGFTSVQTSPAQVGCNPGVWYNLYQPLGYYAGTNDLGTVDELKSLCAEADKYGIKVVVDVIANHLAGDHTNIQNDLKGWEYWHHPDFPASRNYNDRYCVTHGNVGMPDINTEHSYVQQCVANYLESLKSYGVDGIRWDTAKHISLPSEGSNFWPSVTKQGLYFYGEILKAPDDRDFGNEHLMKEYTNYMSVTDSMYGKALRDAFNEGKVPTSYGNWAARGISNDKLVYWGESHDTWSNNHDWGYSNEMSQNVIDRAYAIAASRDDISALYFSRPSSKYKETIYGGQKGSTHFESPEVAEVNKFHNAMIGQKDYYTTKDDNAVVCREKGAVVVAGNGGNKDVTVPNGESKENKGKYTTQPGKYIDQITGAEWTVTEENISGKIGSTGIAVLMQKDITPIVRKPVYFDNADQWNTVYAYYWSDSNKAMTTWPGTKMNASNENENEYKVEIPENAKYVIFNDGNTTKTDDLTISAFNKVYKNGEWCDRVVIPPTLKKIYYNNASNWNKVHAYYWSDSNEAMTTWPGVEMSNAGGSDYAVEIPDNAEYIIFNDGNTTKTDDLTLEGFDKIYKDGSWSVYDDPIPTLDEIYYKNTNNWNKVYTYYWSDSNKAMTTWPGVEMSNEKNDVYKAQIPTDAKYVIFTNGNGTQTDDLTLEGFDKIYDNGSWSVYVGTEEPIPEGNIFYQNTENWDDVYAYYWSESDTKLTTWPGVQMTDAGNGVYAIEIPEEAENIIFNNGNGTQTDDITLEGLNKIYNNGSWSNFK